MKMDMRRELARQPFEQKLRKVSQLIQLADRVKASRATAEPFIGTSLSESVLARDRKPPQDKAAWRNL